MGIAEIIALLVLAALKLAALIGVVFVGTSLALWSHDRGRRAGGEG
jgi:hypothetical protein